MTLAAVILAAGQGTRMQSDLPKVLHTLGGRPLIQYSVETAQAVSDRPPVVVVAPDAEAVRQAAGDGAQFVEQAEPLGTGHAARQAAALLRAQGGRVLIWYADMPLLRPATLAALAQAQAASGGPLALLTITSPEPRGFGRVVRHPATGQVTHIVEEAQATPEQLALRELNAGVYCCEAEWLWPALEKLPLSPKGEYYVTDLVALAVADGLPVGSVAATDPDELIGVNTRVHLAELEAALRRRINQGWMEQGVTLLDPATTYIAATAAIGRETTILPNTHLWGGTRVGAGCVIGPNTIVRDTTIGDHCRVECSVLEGAVVEDEVSIGPFAHLRQGAHLARGVHMGNFGEVKNSYLGPGVKMGHFSYLGDATLGAEVNVGAGAITCNFDGERKNKTEIGAGAFIGSDSMLVAPVTIGARARTGAGSVVTRNVPDDSLAVGVPARVIRRNQKKQHGG